MKEKKQPKNVLKMALNLHIILAYDCTALQIMNNIFKIYILTNLTIRFVSSLGR